MIFYFSGCGNSKYVASRISKSLNPSDKIFFIPQITKEFLSDYVLGDNEKVGFVFPVYSWGVPPIVTDFIKSLPEKFIEKIKSRYIWTAMTCGDETGLAPNMLEENLNRVGLSLSSGWSVIMPNTYVLLPGFDVDSKEVERDKLDASVSRISHIVATLNENVCEKDYLIGTWPMLKSKLLFPLFKRFGIFPNKWKWSQECVSCGKCAAACPVKNITMKGEHPSWRNNCVSCLACYNICPVHAIEYGRVTKNKGQYMCHR